MKSINNYINERLNPRHLGSTDKFPIDGTVEEVCNFLKTNGFEEMKFIPLGSITSSFESNLGKRIFMKNKTWVRFADMTYGEISFENPIFYYYSYPNKEIEYRIYYEVTGRKLTAKEFLDLVNKHFNWK